MARRRQVKAAKKKPASNAGRRDASPGVERPTPEMEARVQYRLGQVVGEDGTPFGVAYRRRPLIESMADKIGLTASEVEALRYYRTAFDRSETSLVKSSLNNSFARQAHGGSAGGRVTLDMLRARGLVRYCEAILGVNLRTMRDVVLLDKSFSEVAIDRFGSRLTAGAKGAMKVVPKSGRHRSIIRDEFIAGMKLLTAQIGRNNRESTEEVWVIILPDGGAAIRRGLISPLGRYRLIGDREVVRSVLAALEEKHGPGMAFASAPAAIEALEAASKGQLQQTDLDDLAA